MPRVGAKRKKKVTHKGEDVGEEEKRKTPRCFVISRGKLERSLQELMQDFRNVNAPNCAVKLKQSRMNKLRDFVNVANHFNVTHIDTFTQTDRGCYMKIGRVPAGPTLTFKVTKFTSTRSIKASQKKPRDSAQDYLVAPLLILNGFKSAASNTADGSLTAEGKTLQLVATTLKNTFPVVDVNTFTVKQCRRVVMFNYDAVDKEIHFRHFAINENTNATVSKGVQKVLSGKVLKKMAKGRTLEDTLLGDGGETSEEEGGEILEDCGAKRAENSVKITLTEIGPRMTMKLVKGEEGLYEGAILFHEFIQKTAEEQALLAKKGLEKERKRKVVEDEEEEKERKKTELQERKAAKDAEKAANKAAHAQSGEDAGEDVDMEAEEASENEDAEADKKADETGEKKKKEKYHPFAWHRNKKKNTEQVEGTIEFGDSKTQLKKAKQGFGKKKPSVMDKMKSSTGGGSAGKGKGKGKGKSGGGKSTRKGRGRLSAVQKD